MPVWAARNNNHIYIVDFDDIPPYSSSRLCASHIATGRQTGPVNSIWSDWMKNFTILLVLVAGLLAGYLIGDYRGKHARAALQQAIETGKTLEIERHTELTRLERELDDINATHRQELEAIRRNNAAREAAWRRTRNELNEQTDRTKAQLAATDSRLEALTAKRNATTGNEKTGLDQQIARLQHERDELRSEIEGNTCLQTRVPHGVAEALNEARANGG